MKRYVIILLFLFFSFTPYGKLETEPYLNIYGLPLTSQQACWCKRLMSISPHPRKEKRELSSPQNLIRVSLGIFSMGLQGDPPIGGAGGIIRLDETNKISFKLGLGRSTNNKAELSALWATMKIANDKQLKRLHIYGD